jgi:hypothetical protein
MQRAFERNNSGLYYNTRFLNKINHFRKIYDELTVRYFVRVVSLAMTRFV